MPETEVLRPLRYGALSRELIFWLKKLKDPLLITHLDLSRTLVTDEAVKQLAHKCKQLRHIALWDSVITDLSLTALAQSCPRLEHLDLGGTQVTDEGLADIAEHCTGLRQIKLHLTRVTDTGVQRLASKCWLLHEIDLGGTRVTDEGVKVLAEKCSQLLCIRLHKTQVTDASLHAIADRCGSLKHIDLGETRVGDSGVKSLAVKCTQLERLFITSTQVTLPDEIVQSSSPNRIREFYARAANDGKQQLNEAKLIVVGNESVGKSALVEYRIRNKPCTDTDPTRGVKINDRINVEKWETNPTQPLTLNVWDFGGQEVQKETHKLFLTTRALYLVVLEARRENTNDAENVLHDWIRTIHNHGKDEIPVIVVITKAEDGRELRLDETRLKKEYPVIRDFIRTSCKTGKNIQELRELIIAMIRKDIPQATAWFPTTYFKVKTAIQEVASQEKLFDLARYATIATQHTVTDPGEQQRLLTLLSEIGVVIRHGERTLLDPNWLTTAIYRILTHSKVVHQGGEFSHEDVGELLRDVPEVATKYPRERWQYIIDQTVECGLSFEIPHKKGHYLMPEQLPPNELSTGFSDSALPQFRYDYVDVPKGLIPRFIVQMHRYLGEQRTAWSNGVVLHIDKSRVLVRADRKNRRVLIYCHSPYGELRETLRIVREGLAHVHTLFDAIEPKPKVPVKAPGKPDAAADYQQLIESERLGVTELVVDGAKCNVSELLHGVGPEPRPPEREDEYGMPRLRESRDQNTFHIHATGPVTVVTGDANTNTTAVPNTLTTASDTTGTPQPPQSSPWQAFIGPGIAAIVTMLLAGMYLYKANTTVTILLTLGTVVFAVFYIIQAKLAWRSTHWPKYSITTLVAAGIGLLALPSLKLILEPESLGKFEVVLDNSPWGGIACFVVAFGFAIVQLLREKWNVDHRG